MCSTHPCCVPCQTTPTDNTECTIPANRKLRHPHGPLAEPSNNNADTPATRSASTPKHVNSRQPPERTTYNTDHPTYRLPTTVSQPTTRCRSAHSLHTTTTTLAAAPDRPSSLPPGTGCPSPTPAAACLAVLLPPAATNPGHPPCSSAQQHCWQLGPVGRCLRAFHGTTQHSTHRIRDEDSSSVLVDDA